MILAPAIGIGFVLWAIAGFGPALHWWELVGIGWLLGDRIALRQEIELRFREFNAWARKVDTELQKELVVYSPGSTRPR